jgi:ubiquinol-cytochrome c reductase iron-sulfur subunit
MDGLEIDGRRRKLLARTTATIGGAGLVLTAIPFIKSMGPSEKARAAGAPVEFDLATLEPGTLKTVEWRGKPVWILHRTADMLARLQGLADRLADPLSREAQQPPYVANITRSLRPQYLVVTAICTHLGCVPVYRPEVGAADLGADWAGGFYCPCHGSKFDLAGRVYKNVPAPRNLEIPPHAYLSDARVLIGADKDRPA